MKKDEKLTDEQDSNSDVEEDSESGQISSLEEWVKNNPPSRELTPEEKKQMHDLAEWCFNVGKNDSGKND
jgi:hypothetical protein